MGKTYKLIFIFLLIPLSILTIYIAKDKEGSNEISQVDYDKIIDEASTLDEVIAIIEEATTESKPEIPTTLTTTTEDPLNILLADGVFLNQVFSYNGKYIAIGDKENIPYMQMAYYEDDNLVKADAYLHNRVQGTITDIEIMDYYINATIETKDSTLKQKFIVSDNGFIPFFKEQITKNYNKNLTIKPKYLVIHETANTGIGANANAHFRYWNRDENAQASTHFVVDNNEIYQMLELNQSAWHVGDNDNHSDITNVNSIGIEVAVNRDGNFDIARQNAIELTISIMKELDMDISQLKRHYDASGKYCPTNMLQSPDLWKDFVRQVELGLKK